jgi:hypothetical protein
MGQPSVAARASEAAAGLSRRSARLAGSPTSSGALGDGPEPEPGQVKGRRRWSGAPRRGLEGGLAGKLWVELRIAKTALNLGRRTLGYKGGHPALEPAMALALKDLCRWSATVRRHLVSSTRCLPCRATNRRAAQTSTPITAIPTRSGIRQSVSAVNAKSPRVHT